MRRRQCLNGEWLFIPDYKGRNPQQVIRSSNWEKEKVMIPSSWKWVINEKADFQPYDMYCYPSEWNDAEAGLVSRKFQVNKKEYDKVFIIFEGVFQRYIVYINNQKVCETEESFLTTEIDITDYVINNDENELKVWCGPYNTIETDTGYKRLAPDGTWYANMARGIWQDVYIEYRSHTYIDDVTVCTSTRNKTIFIKANVMHTKDKQLELSAKIFEDDKVLKELELIQEGMSEPIGQIIYQVNEIWQDVIYWSPENPHLYKLEVQLCNEGNIIDTYDIHFGFREIWLEGHKFYLNGTRMNLRGDAWHYQGFVQQSKEYVRNWYKTCKETGINFVRLHGMPYPKMYLDIADEVGMLVIDESAIYGSAKRIQADHPEFIKNCREHLKKLVRRDKNHPSVIIWSMQNEMRWVDGREGYKIVMKNLSASVKELDNSRPIAYDGDNRLVDPEDMEIISMHYNIDGTVKDWSKEKSLIFGEHGKWHYVSPQVSTAMKGSDVYLSFDSCIDSIGLEEKHFIEHSRREEVTGVSPFNMINYTMHMQPKHDVPIPSGTMKEEEGLPKVIKAHTTPIGNGYYEQEKLFCPNPSWKHLKDAFKPVTIIPNEYNHSFFDGSEIIRSFSIYNDQEADVEGRIDYKLISDSGEIVLNNDYAFRQQAGEKQEWELLFSIPNVLEKTTFELKIELYHNHSTMDQKTLHYKVYPSPCKENCLDTSNISIGYFGENEGYEKLKYIVSKLTRLDQCNKDTLEEIDFIIIGNNCSENIIQLQPVLYDFTDQGGFLLILEQESLVPGEVTLSGKKFFSAFINDKAHPIFDEIDEEDLFFWGPENINNPQYTPVVANGFNKPIHGDMNILLECGEGDFGWGGLMWTPMVEYSVGQGRVLLSQLNIMEQFNKTPQASLILSNMIQYGIDCIPMKQMDKDNLQPTVTGLLTSKNTMYSEFLQEIGVNFKLIFDYNHLDFFDQLIVNIKDISDNELNTLVQYVDQGGKLMILPVKEEEKYKIQYLLGNQVELKQAPVYQLKASEHELTRGLSSYDLYHYEKVTYSPADKDNSVICQYAVKSQKGLPLFENVKNPWNDFFVKGFDEEFMKIAIADRVEEGYFERNCYGFVQEVGKGQVIVSQLSMNSNNDKIKRIYSRLLLNYGVRIYNNILTYEKKEKDFGIQSVMVIPKEKHQDFNEMEHYFSDKNYLLNNLGEGVFGWMKRVDKKDGIIRIVNSSEKTYFITLFIKSDINRNPEKRDNGQLPDSSIVPNLYMDINCPFQLFINGQSYYSFDDYMERSREQLEMIEIEDVVLDKGINRMCIICQGSKQDIKLNVCFKNKYGDYINNLKYLLTLD